MRLPFDKKQARAVLQSRNCAPIFRRGLSKATRGPFRCSMGPTRSHGSFKCHIHGILPPKTGEFSSSWTPPGSQKGASVATRNLAAPTATWGVDFPEVRTSDANPSPQLGPFADGSTRLRLSALSTQPCSRASLNLLSQRAEERHMSPTDP